jgi:phosphohistidine phosphatase
VWTTGEPWNPDGPGFEPSKQPRQIVYSCDAYGWPVAGGGPGVGIVGLPQRTADGEIHPGKNPIVPDFGTDYSRLDEEPWWREVYKAAEAKPLGLILVRHGEADDGHEEMLDDERPLTKEGEKKLAKGFKGLARLGMTADRVVTSKTKRTEQTADLLSKAIGDGTYRTSDGLHHHDFDPKTACELIQEQPKGSTLALVGHHEWLGPFTDFLVNGTKMKGANGAPRKNHGIKFGYGSVARLEFENQRMPGNAHLHALFSPRSLRKLAK